MLVEKKVAFNDDVLKGGFPVLHDVHSALVSLTCGTNGMLGVSVEW